MMKRLLWLALLLPGLGSAATLSWDHPGTGVDGYRVYLNGVEVAEVSVKQATVTLPQAGGSYTVTAFDATRESAPSNQLHIFAAPTNLTIIFSAGG